MGRQKNEMTPVVRRYFTVLNNAYLESSFPNSLMNPELLRKMKKLKEEAAHIHAQRQKTNEK